MEKCRHSVCWVLLRGYFCKPHCCASSRMQLHFLHVWRVMVGRESWGFMVRVLTLACGRLVAPQRKCHLIFPIFSLLDKLREDTSPVAHRAAANGWESRLVNH